MPDIPDFYDADERKWYFDENVQAIHGFEELLKHYDFDLLTGSSLEDMCLQVMNIYDASLERTELDGEEDPRDLWRMSAGLIDFVRKIISVADNSEFEKLLSHLELMLDPKAGIVQNMRSLSIDQSTQKLFELYIAVLAMKVGRNLELDPVNGPPANNPDIIFQYRGKRWGLACKMMNTDNPKTYRQRLEDGIDQIERAEVDRGFVILSLKNVISHDAMLPKETPEGEQQVGHFGSVRGAAARLLEENPFGHNAIQSAWNDKDDLQHTFEDKKAEPMCLEFSSTAVGVDGAPTLLRSFNCHVFGPSIIENIGLERLLKALNLALHDITIPHLFRG